ncbi:general odorant-binding protein 56a [Drosophila takahashii]|uniref:general odorant-binding protein 56a n=1 Tax=Drosophila takahashii TaxID=29030 RepID=UPI0007E8ADB4|nr:general odorant-binding protein 56a-like [Drosophila takahashii]
MKVLLISTFLVTLSVLDTPEPSFVKTAHECAKRNKITHNEAIGVMMSYKEKKNPHNVKCFINCIFQRSAILDVLRKRFKGEKHNCNSIKDANKCEESSQKFDCFLKTEKKLRKKLRQHTNKKLG